MAVARKAPPDYASFIRAGAFACLVIALTAIIFWPAVRHDFVAWDDDINVYENPLLNPSSTKGIIQFWKGPYLRLYIPLTYTVWSFIAQYCQHRGSKPFSLPPHPFHAANVLIHILSAVAAFLLLKRLLALAFFNESTNDETRVLALDWAAALGALLFALHPIQVEPVAWVSGLRDVLSGLGGLCAMEEFLAFRSSRGSRAVVHYATASLAFLAALLSKPSAIMVPVMTAILDIGFLRRQWKKSIFPIGFWLVLSGAFAWMTQSSQGATHIRALLPLWQRPLIAGDSLAFYLYKLVLPIHLSPDYGRAPDFVVAQKWLYYTWLVPACAVLASGFAKEKRVYWSGISLFAAGVFPVLGFVPFLHQDLSTVADRYLYLSVIGPATVLAWILGRARGRSLWAATVIVVIALGVLSRLQAAVWTNTGSLFGHIVALNPDSGVAHLNLGNDLMGHGKFVEARFHFMETLRLRPGDGLAQDNLGSLSLREGKLDEAISWYSQALKNGVPDNVLMAHAGLGLVFSRQGKSDQAADQYKQALQINPNRADIHHALAIALAQQGKTGEALAHDQWALQIRPDLIEIHKDVAVILAQQGKMDEARREFALGIGAGPDSLEAAAALCDSLQVSNQFERAAACYRDIVRQMPQSPEAHNAFGFVLQKTGKLDEARKQYEEAVRLKPAYRQAQFNLSSLMLQSGRTDEAIATISSAIAVMPDAIELRHNLGVALMEKGRSQEAITQFRAVLKARPDFEPSRRALAQLGVK